MSVISIIYHPEINTSLVYEYVCTNGVHKFLAFNHTDQLCLCDPPSLQDSFEQIGFNNGVIMSVFSLIGFLLLVISIILLAFERSLRTAFGINCLLLSVFDAILMFVIFLGESPIYLLRYLTDQLFNEFRLNPTIKPNDFIVFLIKYIQFISPFENIAICIIFTTRQITLFLRFIKTANRFIALYYPWKNIFTIKNTLYICLLFTIFSFLIFSPLIIAPNQCRVEISSYVYYYFTDCAGVYYYYNFIFEICIALCSTILDIASIMRLRKSKPANNTTNLRRKQEILMLIQNCSNLSVFAVSFIPFILLIILQMVNPCLINQPVGAILKMIQLNSLKIVIGHGLDAIFSLTLLYRLAKYNRMHAKSMKNITITVVKKKETNLSNGKVLK